MSDKTIVESRNEVPTARAKEFLTAYDKATADEAKYRKMSEDASLKRAQALKLLWKVEHWTMARIARSVGMTRQRVQQLVSKFASK